MLKDNDPYAIVGGYDVFSLRHLCGKTVRVIEKKGSDWCVDVDGDLMLIGSKYLYRCTPSGEAKALGLISLKQAGMMTGVSLNTLTNWHRDKHSLFVAVIIGCRSQLAA